MFKRGGKIDEVEMQPGIAEPVDQLIAFGSWLVACCSTRLEVWKSLTLEHYTTIVPSASRSHASVGLFAGGMCNMPTFLNKILVGRQDGSVEMWNVSTGRLIHTIPPPSATSGPVSAIQPSPALGVVAIATTNGPVMIHDMLADECIIKLKIPSNQKSIISISFRSDGLGAGDDGQKPGIAATACQGSGDVTLWDLNDGGRVSGVLRGAHNPPPSIRGTVLGGIRKIEFLPGQDVLVTAGLDNSVKTWIFDAKMNMYTPRILHSRSGHAATVTLLSFVPTNSDGADARGKWLLSAGRDQSLWGWSLRKDGQSTELSQGHIRKRAKKLGMLGDKHEAEQSPSLQDLKAPEVTCMDCSMNRDGGMGAFNGGGTVWANVGSKKGPADATESSATGWESVVTGHRGDKYARTWFWGRKRAGRWAFESGDGSEVTSVAMSPCGTFALVGSVGGSISMFNMQSGFLRQKFPSPLTPTQARKLKIAQASGHEAAFARNGDRKFGLGEGKHRKAVTGLMVDSVNRTLISCGLDGKIKFWDFTSGILLSEIDWSPMASILGSRYHRSNDLVAFSCDDLSIRIIDTETKKLVRELWGCLGQISDYCISNDGRWVIAASMDSIVRVWDLPTGNLINAIRMESPCTALAFSDTGEFLATAHADGVGINLWNNRTLFAQVRTRMINEDEILPAVPPSLSGGVGETIISAAFEEPDQHPEEEALDSYDTTN